MRRTLIAVTVASLLAVGCGGDSDQPVGDDGADVVGDVVTIPPIDSAEVLAEEPTNDDGDVIDELDGLIDCAVANDPVAQAPLFGIQVIAQIATQDQVDLIKNGSLAFDGPGLTAFLEAIRPLGGHDIPPFGDPADEIEFYLEATRLAAAIVAVDGPVPQEMFDELAAHNGDVQDFIMRQTSMAAAIDQACP